MNRFFLVLAGAFHSVAFCQDGLKPADCELFNAIENRSRQVAFTAAKQALNRGANPNALRYWYSDTPLYIAIVSGQVDKVELLLERGADPNFCPMDAKTCLLEIAIGVGTDGVTDAMRERMVRLLLEKEANPNGKANLPRASRPLNAAVSGNATGIFRLLLAAGGRPDNSEQPILLEAAKNANAEVLAALLRIGEGPGNANGHGVTALWVSTEKKCVACVKVLLQAGAQFDPAEAPTFGSTTTWSDVICLSTAEVIGEFQRFRAHRKPVICRGHTSLSTTGGGGAPPKIGVVVTTPELNAGHEVATSPLTPTDRRR